MPKTSIRRRKAEAAADRRRLRALRERFARAHRAGMQALAQENFGALGAAIDDERVVIQEQREIIERRLRPEE